MLSFVRSYRAGLNWHQWDGGVPVSSVLPALIASTAVTTAAAAALSEAAWANIGATQIRSEYGELAPLAGRSPPPFLIRDLAPKDALAINRSIPLSSDANPPAQPFRFTGDSVAYFRALACLAAATYYEAGNETRAGKHAVAQVVLNRVRHPAFAKSVCGVVYEGSTRSTGCQFTFTCDGSLRRRPSLSGWRQSVAVAKAALDGAVYSSVGYSTHYHADYVVPYWATSLAKNAVIGTHIFYRWPASWGRPGAFNRAYDGAEIDPRLLLQAALRVSAPERSRPATLMVDSDPRVELVGIVDFLANNRADSGQASFYRHQVSTYFRDHSNHLAVQSYRQMTTDGPQLRLPQLAQIIMHYSAPPELEPRGGLSPELVSAAGGEDALASLISALREFAVHTDFQRFWQDQQPVYAALAAQAQARQATLQSAKDEMFAAMSTETPRVILAPLLQDAILAGCERPSNGASNAWLIVAGESRADRGFDELFGAGVRCETELASRN